MSPDPVPPLTNGEPSAASGGGGVALVRCSQSPSYSRFEVLPAPGSLHMAGFESMRAIEILMVEDNPGDVRLTREAFKDGRVWNRMHVVEDGLAALDFLHRRPP